MEEIWKDVVGYEGLYQVSNLGRVRSLCFDKRHKGRVLKQSFDGKGNYLFVGLHKGGKAKQKNVHRLVAETFIPNPNNLPCVNHINEVKTDNRAINLEWCTVKYNSNYGNAKKNMIDSRRKNNDQEEINRKIKETKRKNGSYSAERPVNQFTWDGKFIKRFCSVTEAGKVTGAKNIHFCCINRFSHSGGFIWLYDEDVNSIGERVLDENPTREILQYDKNGAFLKKWGSPICINRELKISLTALSNCLHGRAKTSGGFIWKYNK